MIRKERERARRFSEYVDAALVQRRSQDELRHADTPDDQELRDLVDLANTLGRFDMAPPPEWKTGLKNQLPDMAARADAEESELLVQSVFANLRATLRRMWHVPNVLRTATATAVLLGLTVAVLSQLSTTKTVSAAQILTRGDTALAELVRPGTVLYQKWRVHDRRRSADGMETVQNRFIEEWLDGSDLQHVAGRWTTTAGQVVTAYTNVGTSGEHRGRVYFAPNPTNDSRGLLSIEPTRREFQETAARFSDSERPMLNEYLARGYIYEPIVGERRFNRAVIEHTAGDELILPRTRISLDDSEELAGVPVYKVRVIDPVRVRFRWTIAGPPVVWLERQETVRYISRETYLTLKTEDDHLYESGERVFTTRELIETRISAADVAREPAFELDVPAGTPARTQSAFDLLTAVAHALNRVSLNRLTEDREQ